MAKNLYNILVPVDFTGKNKWAISKAVELSNSFHCNIHLVHVARRSKSLFYQNNKVELAYNKLKQLKSIYSRQLCGEGRIELSVLTGRRQKQLVNYANDYEMDLVITGLSRFNLLQRIISSISISRLAKKTNKPVLAVRASGLVSHFKKIVLPVSGEIPLRQIRLTALLGRAFRSTVYFVTLRQHADSHQNLMDKALELVQSISTIPVQCFLLEGKNLAKSTLDFSRKINADLIMVPPARDFRLPGLWNRLTNKLITYASNIPVVTMTSEKNA